MYYQIGFHCNSMKLQGSARLSVLPKSHSQYLPECLAGSFQRPLSQPSCCIEGFLQRVCQFSGTSVRHSFVKCSQHSCGVILIKFIYFLYKRNQKLKDQVVSGRKKVHKHKQEEPEALIWKQFKGYKYHFKGYSFPLTQTVFCYLQSSCHCLKFFYPGIKRK